MRKGDFFLNFGLVCLISRVQFSSGQVTVSQRHFRSGFSVTQTLPFRSRVTETRINKSGMKRINGKKLKKKRILKRREKRRKEEKKEKKKVKKRGKRKMKGSTQKKIKK